MLDKTIDSALQNLRRNLIRNGGDGLDHVEALMRIRGVEFAAPVKRPRKPDHGRRGIMRQIILDAVRNGPKTCWQVTLLVSAARPGITLRDANKRTRIALSKMRHDGLLGHEGRLWGKIS